MSIAEPAVTSEQRQLESLIHPRIDSTADLTEIDGRGCPLTHIDVEACTRIARWVSHKNIPPDREDLTLHNIPSHQVSNFFLPIVAICHQTSPIGHLPLEGTIDGVRRKGWDYLVARFASRCRTSPGLLHPRVWSQMTAHDLTLLFRDEVLGDRLTGNEVRADLLRDLGNHMLRRGWTSADAMLDHAEGRIATGARNLLTLLTEFRSYSDPVFKKSLFFLALMRNTGHWTYVDDEFLGPPVDYHEVRGHLRVGTVSIVDRSLLSKVLEGRTVTAAEDVAIRRSVFKAIMIISNASGLRNPTRLHYLLWNLFRTICVRIDPRCSAPEVPAQLPDRYRELLDVDNQVHCPFEGFCSSAHAFAPIIEHNSLTDYY